MKKLNYKPVAIQDECWGKFPDMIVLVKFEAQGKVRKYYKVDALSFENKNELKTYISKHKVKILSWEKFRATPLDNTLLLAKAMS